jgi:3-deoxy-D-manno-octulosonate 8-phosphate phosphatase (KDO 8-P phosphatase)
MTPDLSQRARQVRLALFDVDGVMTDGTLFVSEKGESFKPFNILDGLGLKLLVRVRAGELDIDHLIQGAADKLHAYVDLRQRLGLEDAQVCYMGDDLPDLPVLRRCGLALSPPDAVDEVRSEVHFVTKTGGGNGAVREACELIMQAQGTWAAHVGPYRS